MTFRIRYDTKERLIEDVKTIGETITEKAEEIVGDWSQVHTYTITATITVGELPQLIWTKQANIVKFPTKAIVIGSEEENDNQQ